jgi:hypothetical protein
MSLSGSTSSTWQKLPAKLRAQLRAQAKRRRLEINPLQWIEHPSSGEIIRLAWLPKQLEAFEQSRGKKLFGLIGGNRLGKTMWAVGKIAGAALGLDPLRLAELPSDPHAWRLGRPVKIWCLTTTLKKSRNVQQAELWRRIPRCFWRSTWRPASGFYNSIAQLTNGSVIDFRSEEQDISELESEAVDALWIDETVRISYVRAGLMRLIDRGGWCIWTTIPDSPELEDVFIRRQFDPASERTIREEDIGYLGGVMRDNPLLSEAQVALIEGLLPERERAMRVFGQFALRTGLVYGDYREALHLEEPEMPVPHEWTRYEVIDPGWDNPCAVLFGGVDDHQVKHVYDEVYERQRTVGEIAALIQLRRWEHRGLLTPDEIAGFGALTQPRRAGGATADTLAAQIELNTRVKAVLDEWRGRYGEWRPARVLIDEYAGQRDQAKTVPLIRQFAEFGIHAQPCSNRNKPAQRARVREALRPLAGHVQLKIGYACKWARFEFTHYRLAEPDEESEQYRDDVERVKPVHNHLMSCLEYWLAENPIWIPPTAEQAPTGTVARWTIEAEQRHEEAEAKAWKRRG